MSAKTPAMARALLGATSQKACWVRAEKRVRKSETETFR